MKVITKTSKSIAALAALLLIGSCGKEDDNPTGPVEPAITLDCNHFSKEGDVVLLKDNPNAPVDYIVICRMQTRADVVVEPGTTIEFQTDAGISIYSVGSLNMEGTASKPITLTGVDKSKGSWAGIFVASKDPKNVFDYVTVNYGGGKTWSSNDETGAISMKEGTLKISNSTLKNSSTYGLYAGYYYSDFTSSNNVFTENNVPVYIVEELVDLISNTDKYIGNTKDVVLIDVHSATTFGPSTMREVGVPYEMYSSNSQTSMTCTKGLTIEPGVKIIMNSGIFLSITGSNGSIHAVGTAAKPIIFEGVAGRAGSWPGIFIRDTNSPLNEIAFTQINHAGEDPGNTLGAIYMTGQPTLNVHDVAFKDILSCAIYNNSRTPNPNFSESNNTFVNCAGTICLKP